MAHNGKIILITGGGSGIGAAAALLFAKGGANVVITGRTAATLQQTADAAVAQKLPGRVVPVVADVASAADWERAIAHCVSTFGGLDVLINNAGWEGPFGSKDFTEIPVADVQKIININVVGPLIGSKLALPELLKRKGTIITVSSVASVVPRTLGAGWEMYAPSKAADDMLTRQLHGSYSARGIKAFGVNPAVYDTPMAGRVVDSVHLQLQGINSLQAFGWTYNPLGTAGDPIDLALVFAALVDGTTKYSSGDCVVVVPGEAPGSPITCDVSHFMPHVTSPVPGALMGVFAEIPLHNAAGVPFAAADAARVRGKIKAHIAEVGAKMAAAMAAAAARAGAK